MTESAVVGELFVRQRIGLTNISLDMSYDLAIAALSWEQRSTSAFQALVGPLPSLTLLKFLSTDSDTEAKKLRQLEVCKTLATEVGLVELHKAVDFDLNASKIELLIRDKVERIGRPIRLLIDITCIPKSYLLYILGFGVKNNYISRIDCVYSEGKYALDVSHSDLITDSATQRGIISEGDWTSLRVPYFESAVSFPNQRDLFVAMGGEVGLSLPFIERYEPTRLGLVLIGESLVQRPDELPEGERLAMTALLSTPNLVRSNVGLADVLGLVTAANQFYSISSEEVVTWVAIGSKPHALALGIAALGRAKMEIVCRVPKRYRPLDVAPAGRYSFYEIEDRFEPTAYLTGVS